MSFFETDFLARITQPVDVIDINTSDDLAIGIDNIHRI